MVPAELTSRATEQNTAEAAGEQTRVTPVPILQMLTWRERLGLTLNHTGSKEQSQHSPGGLSAACSSQHQALEFTASVGRAARQQLLNSSA